MRSISNTADLWYPRSRALKFYMETPSCGGALSGEKLERGTESMKRYQWLMVLCLGVAAGALLVKDYDFQSAQEIAGPLRGSRRRLIKPRLTTEPGYARCEPRADSDVWCSAPPVVDLEPGRSPSKADPAPDEGVSRGLLRPEALPQGADSQRISSQSRESLEQWIRRLEISAHEEPNNARTLSDLASAYFVRGQQNEDLSDLVLALSKIDEAVRADGQLHEALFNRALFLQELSLRTEAWLAWQKYLSLEDEPGWSAEAEAHLQSLQRISAGDVWKQQQKLLEQAALAGDESSAENIVKRFRQPARKYVEETVLGLWGEAVVKKDGGQAENLLKIAHVIGAALRQTGGDEMAADAVAAIDEARKEPAERLQRLAEGHLSYFQGKIAFDAFHFDKARPQLGKAERSLREAGSPFAAWARLQIASCDYYQDRFEEARQALEEIDRSLLDDRYSSLRGRIHFILGSMDVRQGRPGDSLRQFERARDLFTKAQETENLVTIDHQFAISLGSLGSKELWHPLFRALRALAEIPSYRRAFGILDEVATAALRDGKTDVALYFQNEMLDTGRRWGDHEEMAFALQRKADTLAASGRTEDALRQLAKASREAERITDPKIRARMNASLALSTGQIELPASPEHAAADLTQAIDHLRASQDLSPLPLALFLRARAFLAVKDTRRASEDFTAGLERIESTRENLTDESLRITFADQATQSFDEILAFESEQPGGEIAAFNLAERARARELLEDLAVAQWSEAARSGGPQPLTVAELQDALPARTLVVKYAVLPDRLLLWSITRDGFNLRTLPIKMQDLDPQVQQVVSAMRSRKGRQKDLQKSLRDLYMLLIAPVANELQPARDLVVVPDKSLHLLPFSALIDPKGRYLVESHGVVVAPSVNVYARCLLRRVSRSHAPLATALLVGDPSFDPQELPSLERLPDAAAEATTIASMYPQSALLVRDEATKWNVLHQIARGPEMIQISAHALGSPEHPEYSRLLLARDPRRKDSGVLYLHEIRDLRFTSTRLVVLAGCGTAAGPVSASEGSLSLARAFLASGVPSVIATRWNIDDATSRSLMTEFHRRLRLGQDPVTALRWSQVAQAKGRDGSVGHPWNWASFQLIGGINPQGGERQ